MAFNLLYTKIEYTETREQQPNNKRNVLLFNPPLIDTVLTNVAAQMYSIDKLFKGSLLKKTLNKKTLKVSYCCKPSI